MEPVYFVMAILGCGDASAACTEARVEPVRYQTVQQCRAALPAGLARNSDLDFPSLSARCRATGPRMVRQDAQGARRG